MENAFEKWKRKWTADKYILWMEKVSKKPRDWMSESKTDINTSQSIIFVTSCLFDYSVAYANNVFAFTHRCLYNLMGYAIYSSSNKKRWDMKMNENKNKILFYHCCLSFDDSIRATGFDMTIKMDLQCGRGYVRVCFIAQINFVINTRAQAHKMKRTERNFDSNFILPPL